MAHSLGHFALCNRHDKQASTQHRHESPHAWRASDWIATHFQRPITDIDVAMVNFPPVHGPTKTQSYSRRYRVFYCRYCGRRATRRCPWRARPTRARFAHPNVSKKRCHLGRIEGRTESTAITVYNGQYVQNCTIRKLTPPTLQAGLSSRFLDESHDPIPYRRSVLPRSPCFVVYILTWFHVSWTTVLDAALLLLLTVKNERVQCEIYYYIVFILFRSNLFFLAQISISHAKIHLQHIQVKQWLKYSKMISCSLRTHTCDQRCADHLGPFETRRIRSNRI